MIVEIAIGVFIAMLLLASIEYWGPAVWFLLKWTVYLVLIGFCGLLLFA